MLVPGTTGLMDSERGSTVLKSLEIKVVTSYFIPTPSATLASSSIVNVMSTTGVYGSGEKGRERREDVEGEEPNSGIGWDWETCEETGSGVVVTGTGVVGTGTGVVGTRTGSVEVAPNVNPSRAASMFCFLILSLVSVLARLLAANDWICSSLVASYLD
ncbi:MAG: hypothetical protein A6F71_09925 [Cycloclasticus sp. symbiont of Poecilosclerida sp. M]|nr:MAG: hypothetical protein A6F71_09925 [Cycloclasticus sp. symbiont of Poecilosclerida sp. M]